MHRRELSLNMVLSSQTKFPERKDYKCVKSLRTIVKLYISLLHQIILTVSCYLGSPVQSDPPSDHLADGQQVLQATKRSMQIQ